MKHVLLDDGQHLAAPADSPLGVFFGLLAELPPGLFQIVRFASGAPSGKTDQIAACLAGLLDEVSTARRRVYHLMAAVGRQQGVNYGEPIMLCYLKPVFADDAASPWLIKTSADAGEARATLVLNRQRASSDLAEAVPTRVAPLELVDPVELEALTGMVSGGVNFLIEAQHYHQSFLACYFQPEMIQLRPGESEYLGAQPDSSLDTAIVEVPLGRFGMHYSALLDGSTFFWMLTELQKQYPQMKFLQEASQEADMLRLALWQMGESLSQGLKKFKLNEQVPVLSYFSTMERYLEKSIQTAHPYLQRDTIAVFVREFVRNFFAVEGQTLYAMIDMAIREGVDSEERLREILYLFHRQFAHTEFAKMLTSLDFDLFLPKLCSDLLEQGFVNEFILQTLLERDRASKAIEKLLPGRKKLRDFADPGDWRALARVVLQAIEQNPEAARQHSYARHEFSAETAKSEKYFVLHAQIVDLLPRFVVRNTRQPVHPLLSFEALQADMISFFVQRSAQLGIGHTTIRNVVRSLVRIIFGKQILLLDIIEDKLAAFSLSLQPRSEPAGLIAPSLARVRHQDQYSELRRQRQQWAVYWRKRVVRAAAGHGHAYREAVFGLVRADLENFLNLPLMREAFGSSAALYGRLLSYQAHAAPVS